MSKSKLGLLILLMVVVALPAAVASGVLPVGRKVEHVNGPIPNPVLEPPLASGPALRLQEFVTMPPSVPTPTDDPRLKRWARINFLGEIAGHSGRLFVPDLNGKMYLIERETSGRAMPHEYLDVGATFSPDFWNQDGLGSGFGFVAFHPEFAKNGKFYTVHTEAGDALRTKTFDLPAQDRTLVHGVVTEWMAADGSRSVGAYLSRDPPRGAPDCVRELSPWNPTNWL